jgi:hypothetical protein
MNFSKSSSVFNKFESVSRTAIRTARDLRNNGTKSFHSLVDVSSSSFAGNRGFTDDTLPH